MSFERLTRKIIENSDSDKPRLVLADYLEELGDPRAELIRIQLQLTRVMKPSDKTRLRKRERQLLREFGPVSELPERVRVVSYYGGFADEIELTVSRFLTLQNEIFSQTPIRSVILREYSSKFNQLKDSPYLHRIRSLRIKQTIDTKETIDLVSSPALLNLRQLELSGGHGFTNGIGDGIANAKHLSKLEELSIDLSLLQDDEVASIVNRGAFDSLTTLRLGYSLNSPAIQPIANSKRLCKLKELQLTGRFSNDAVAALQGGHYRALECLRLTSWPSQIVHGFRSPNPLPKLKTLQVRAGLDHQAVQYLCDSYTNLEKLNLAGNAICDRGMRILAKSKVLNRLRTLILTGNEITAAGVEALLKSKYWKSRTRLHLRNNRIDADAIASLRKRYGKSFGNFGS